ncbi:MAG: nickel pincer cofactor biosynthesis protein LarB [Candidatus Lokiarchaeota archaeon]|nr:nickel pincer cofactor biosynthesis protein LarB [Candidatus Lokiarchaeota archaeon]
MDLREILHSYKKGDLNEDEVLKLLKMDHLEKIDQNVKLDVLRMERTGFPEIIFAQSKPKEVLGQLIEKYLKSRDTILISRLQEEQYQVIKDYQVQNPNFKVQINKKGKIACIFKPRTNTPIKGKIGIITAGTSDIMVAEEIKTIAEAMDCEVMTAYDVGIAGFHRIFQPLKDMIEQDVDVIVVAAGMEGTLPSVVSALIDIPVIGVPTSNGYGYKGKGEAALSTMLQSCAPGLSVVNIDNGVGAAASAILIAKGAHKHEIK